MFSKRELNENCEVCIELPNWKTYEKQHYTQSRSVFVDSLIAYMKNGEEDGTVRAVMRDRAEQIDFCMIRPLSVLPPNSRFLPSINVKVRICKEFSFLYTFRERTFDHA